MTTKIKKVLITGGSGMVGQAFNEVQTEKELILLSSRDCDLRDKKKTYDLFDHIKPDAVIHLAARVGGIQANMSHMAEFYLDNVLINTHVLEASRRSNVKKVVSLLSTCVYPDNVSYPLTEEQIHNGKPHSSNFAYAHAKRMLDIQSRAYRDQYGCNFITAVPNNLFGENDNYHLEHSHVIPAIMHKMLRSYGKVKLWGDGSPLREFTYSFDLAKILLFLLEYYEDSSPINVGNTNEFSIRDVAYKIKHYMGFSGEIEWDTTKPSGQFRKPSSNEKLRSLGWSAEDYTPFDDALEASCLWFKSNYPNVRGA